MSVNPVFLDETGRRWKLVRPVLLTGAAALVAIPVSLLLSIQNVSVTPEKLTEPDEASLSQAAALPVDRISFTTRPWRITRRANSRAVRHE